MKNLRLPLWALLTLLVVASLTIRVAALAHWRTGAIESEGAEYARIAENLRNGVGYIGLVRPGPQLVFNPLFPLLIAGASFVTHDYEWAGRLVSLVLGALLPVPVFGIASRLFDRRVGLVAAVLTIFFPPFVNLSFTVFSEGPYATVLLSAIYAVVRALECPSTGRWLLAGGGFGLAYLLRAEAFAAFLIAVVFAVAAGVEGPAVRCKRAAAAMVIFVALALPEVVFIYKSTGSVRLEGKSAQFFALGKRILMAEKNPGAHDSLSDASGDEPSSEPNVKSWEPWEVKWAFYAVDGQLRRTGVIMRPDAQVIPEAHLTLRERLQLAGMGLRKNGPTFFEQISDRWLGSPFLPALALLGALRRPWRKPQALVRLFAMLVAAAPVIATFSAFWTQLRYYFVLVPLFIIWAANGLVEIGRWAKATSAGAGWGFLARPVVAECIIPGLIGLTLITYMLPVRGTEMFREGSTSTRVEKELGLWIWQQQNPCKIMDLRIPLTFHARAQSEHFPYCSGEIALRFLDAAQVDYVVLRRKETFTKYYEDWLAHGIPDPRAELLHIPPQAAAEFIVYRWHRGV